MNQDSKDTSNSNLLNEKNQKYGDQKINFFKTSVVIIILLILLIPVRQRYNDLFRQSRHLAYYPKETQVYFDVKTNKFNSQIKSNKYFSGLANNSEYFSFGFWKLNKSSRYGKLAAFQFKTKEQPVLYVQKLKTENYKHHTISYMEDKSKFYTIDKENLFISDNASVLKELIDRIENGRKGLFELKNIRNVLGQLDKSRNGTVFILDHNIISGTSFAKKIPGLSKLVDYFDISAFAVDLDGDNITAEGKTIIDYKKIKDRNIISSFKNFNKEHSSLDENCFVPEKAMMYASVGNLKNILNLVLAVNDIKQQPEYKQILDVAKDATGLDVENDLLDKFNGCSSFVLTPSGKNVEAVGLFKTSKNVQPDVIKLANFLQMQNNSIKFVDTTIEGYSLSYLKANKSPYSVYFGNLNDGNFVIGQQNAIKEIINAIKNDQTAQYAMPKAQVAVYLDANAAKTIISRLKRSNILATDYIDFVKAEFSVQDNVINSFIKVGTKKIHE
jgi:hypothetical protein